MLTSGVDFITVSKEKDVKDFVHTPVLLEESIEGLNCRQNLTYIDATLGGGGHSCEIAKLISPTGRLISFDVDPEAIAAAQEKLLPWKENVTIFKSNYSKIPEILRTLNIEKISGGILFDLGTSYHQLMTAAKGFSFSKEARLDMRFDPDSDLTAYDVVNSYSEEELRRIFWEYGEERFSKKIARKIVDIRKDKAIQTTLELANMVRSCIYSPKSKIHPATRIFQAIRIAVNNELCNLEKTLKEVIELLDSDAVIAIISFHSLEDRLVKNLFKYYSSSCKCLPEQIICSCNNKRELEVLTKKPVIASQNEISKNPPSRSAKLRVAKRV